MGETNKKTIYERVKEWRIANPEKARLQRKRYYDKHAELLREKRRAKYALQKKNK